MIQSIFWKEMEDVMISEFKDSFEKVRKARNTNSNDLGMTNAHYASKTSKKSRLVKSLLVPPSYPQFKSLYVRTVCKSRKCT